jgi:Flp pilus assembly protein TadD
MRPTIFFLLAVLLVTGCKRDNRQKAQSLASKASRLMNEGKLTEAIIMFKEASSLRPMCAEYHVGVAMASVKVKDYTTARDEYTKALPILQEQSQEDPERVCDLIMVLVCLNRNQEANTILNAAKERFKGNRSISMFADNYSQFIKGISEFQLKD